MRSTASVRRIAALIALTLAGGACSDDAPTPTQAPLPTAAPAAIDTPGSRPFLMGFTRWPYDFDAEAVDWTWQAIRQHGDVVTVHLDAGVPWQEAADGTDFPERVRAELDGDRRRAEAFDTVVVTATPQHSDRATIARYWGDEGSQMPLPPEWEDRHLDDPAVVAAYLAYCRRVIDLFDPDYFVYGIEVNAGYTPGTPPHDQIIGLAAEVYPALKADYPGIPILLSFQIGSWEATTEQVMEITATLLPYTDIVGLSAYPFLDFSDPTRPAAEPTPVDEWMSRFAALGKPLAITETGYAAEPLVIPTLGIDTESRPEWQLEYVTDLLESAARHDAQFVTYWEIRDYDEGYEFLIDLGADPTIASIWRDIGLYDGTGEPRPSLAVWDAWLELPVE